MNFARIHQGRKRRSEGKDQEDQIQIESEIDDLRQQMDTVTDLVAVTSRGTINLETRIRTLEGLNYESTR